jgi:hypothetical protein
MRSHLLRLFLIGALFVPAFDFATAQQTQPQQTLPQLSAPNPEDIKHGAVLCVWSIYIMTKEFGDHCLSPKDEKTQSLLDQAIAHIDQFIIDNTPATREEVEKLKRAVANTGDPVCSPVARRLYERVQKAGSEEMDRSIANLLSVPRKPAMNPCL